jgi:hypothetical protein
MNKTVTNPKYSIKKVDLKKVCIKIIKKREGGGP